MSEELRSFLIVTSWMHLVLLASLGLTVWRSPGGSSSDARRSVMRAASAAVLVHGVHFAEEWSGGLHERIAEVTGLATWSESLFVGFNFAWIGIWVLGIVGVRWAVRGALAPLWLLGIGSAVNVLAHPVLAAAVGGYFPGLWTSPLCGVAGVCLLRRLTEFTTDRQRDPESA